MSVQSPFLVAGIQGCCAALALAAKGYQVKLVDAAEDVLMRASLRNTGKIHLGHVYAADPSLRTSLTMLKASLAFSQFLDRWTDNGIEWQSVRSVPYTYLVMQDSIVSTDALLEHYAKLETVFQDYRSAHTEVSYLGTHPTRLHQPIDIPTYCNHDIIDSAVATEELSVDQGRLCGRLRNILHAHPSIELLLEHKVEHIDACGSEYHIAGTLSNTESWSLKSVTVVNALWHNRLALDSQLGIVPSRNWIHRLKYRVYAPTPDSLRGMNSLSMVLGPYGDIVPWGDEIYLQWYPSTRDGWCDELQVPEEWNRACQDLATPETLDRIGRPVVEGLSQVVPGLGSCIPTRADAGIIFSWGETDIDDPNSEFHERFRTGVHTFPALPNYYSIDSGKFTNGPVYADQLCRLIGGEAEGSCWFEHQLTAMSS